MRSVMMTVLVVLVSSVAALGQQYVPVVANQVVQQPVQQLPMVQPAPPVQHMPLVPVQQGYLQPQVPQEWLVNGYREEFRHNDVHEVRPIRDWENYQYPQQQVYQNQWIYPQQTYPQYQQQYYYQPQQYYYPSGCYQQPQMYYCVPQQRQGCFQRLFGY